mmetsp:Transcript_54789/g.143113  ORF Transcript_54789/g.143113 Transcript_54789/m.143113 type:complete len:943 (+) Transcript_54789:86-2914(+)
MKRTCSSAVTCLLVGLCLLQCTSANMEVEQGEAHDTAMEAKDYETLYLLFALLLTGAAVIHLTTLPQLQAVPVTVVFFVLGIVFALVAEAGHLESMQGVANSYRSWASIDPHLVLFVFLPPLLFSDAMAVDTHVARRVAGQCLLLAVAGVVMGALATGAVLYHLLPYEWSFVMSLMVGSILCATDPVAVVSLLKDLGASPILTMQIQGESLLNDGTAMVLFNLSYSMVGGEQLGVLSGVAYLLKSTLGAWAFGTALGLLFCWWIRGASDRLSHKSLLIQILLTISCAYLSFLLSEGLWHISGVLSTVAAALVLAHFMWPEVVERRAMLEFWHVIETVGNILVFSLAGVLTGQSIPKHSFEDFVWVLVVYVLLIIIRFVTIVVLWPALNLSGQPVRMRDILVMTWGGLRGMVGLALAILVREDRAQGALDQEDADHVLFMVGCIAALTLVVNATTAPALCGLLGITQTAEGRKVLVRNVARRAEAHVKSLLGKLLSSGDLPRECMLGPVSEAVEELTGTVKRHVVDFGSSASAASQASGLEKGIVRRWSMLSLTEETSKFSVDDLWASFHEQKAELLKTQAQITQFRFGAQLGSIKQILDTQPVDHHQLQVVREVFLEAVRARYWDQIEEGHFMSGSRVPAFLLNSVSIASHRSDEGLTDWAVLERDLAVCSEDTFRSDMKAWQEFHAATGQNCQRPFAWRVPLSQRFRANRLQQHFHAQTRAQQVISAFIAAHMQAQSEIAGFFGSDESVDSPAEAVVILESQIEVFKASAMRARISKPVQKKMATAWEVNHLCEQYRRFITSAHGRGVLTGRETEFLVEPVVEVMHSFRRKQADLSDYLAKESSELRSRHIYDLDAAVLIQRAYRRWRSVQTTKVGYSKSLQTVKSFADPARAGRTLLELGRAGQDGKCSSGADQASESDCIGVSWVETSHPDSDSCVLSI